MEESKNLRLARQARAEDNSEDAKLYYSKVREEDPENGEAKFFYAYYSLYEGTNGELPKRFDNLCNVVESSINMIKKSSMSKEEKIKSIEEIVNAFSPETGAEISYMRHKNIENRVGESYVTVFEDSAIKSVYLAGIAALENMGNQVGNLYDNDAECKKIASIIWEDYILAITKWYSYRRTSEEIRPTLTRLKEIGDQLGEVPEYKYVAVLAWSKFVKLAQQFYAYVEKGEAEKYAEKIKKLDPSYVMPKKSGCISKIDYDL